MTDRELLELAAKAANVEGHIREWVNADPDFIETDGDTWNPLTDDGDALRLAVKLRIEIYPDDGAGETVTAFMVGQYGYNTTECWGDHSDDELAATRRAVVRAAAQIGKEMP